MNDQSPVRVKDLFDIPEHVRKTDFVVKLSEGVDHADETARTYVVTPAIREALSSALGLVKTSLDTGRSHAAYVQGSFGSGKSHFMAMLSLLLENNDAAWRVPELHGLRETCAWVKDKSVLQLRFHMVGQKSLEAAIFGEYVRWVRATKPDAPFPPLFADDALFQDARRLLETLGDEKFFAPMNPKANDPRWGKRASAGTWNGDRFEQAAVSSDPEERAKLFDALARTHFTAFGQQRDQFIDMDGGLAVLARHAKGLGYDGVLLLLDELVLWLASGASNASWLHNEVQKAAKLVEAQNSARDIPIVSFIARQRDLADLVGNDLAGAENQRLRESLAWFKDRFERIELGDNNLPDIVSQRILHAKNEAAKKALDDAFKALQAKAGASWTTLLATEDATAFRKLYPFSPAVVETLVALSNSLQRNRTAIRLLMELLVDYIPDVTVGEVVPVGDLFDVLAGGDDTTDGVMRAHFEQARHLYSQKLLPMIQETHGTTSAARCQRLRPDHRAMLGCSGCVGEVACRADNRLVKTLLLAALAPAARTLKGLTVGRLVQLNHGTLRAMIPGTEAMTAAARMRHYASTLGQLHVGSQADPSVDIDVAGVDLEPILAQARDADTPGARQKIIRDVLFANLGLDPSGDWGQNDRIDDWRGTVRKGHVRFTNVRRATPEMLRCEEGHDWRLVLDYPFDDAGFGPNDDLAVIDKLREEGEGSWTLILLPSFFSEAVNKILGELAVLDHLLASKESKRVAVQHLRPEQQSNAEMGLENLRGQKRARLNQALLEAYGLSRETEANIDPSRSVGEHFLTLKPEVRIRAPLGGTLSVARTTCIPQLLDEKFPRHPNLRKLTKLVVERVLERFADLLERDGKPLELEKDDLEKMRGTLGELGVVKTSEGAAHVVTEGKLQDLEQRRRQRNVDQPTAAEVRGWIDEGRKMGLQPDAQDLVVRAYAIWAARTFVLFGKPYAPSYGTAIPDEAVLEKPELPTQSEWVKAIDLAGHAFGITLPRKALNADNVKRFEVELAARLQKLAGGAAKMGPVLERRLVERNISGDVDRLVTARSGAALCATLEGKRGVEQVRALAAFEPQTSAKAVGVGLAAAAAGLAALDDKLIFGAFARLPRNGAGALSILDDVERALRLDEVHESLAPALRRQAEAANEWLTATLPAAETKPVAPAVQSPVLQAPPTAGTCTITREATKAGAREALAAIAKEVEAALKDEPGNASVSIEVRITRKS